MRVWHTRTVVAGALTLVVTGCTGVSPQEGAAPSLDSLTTRAERSGYEETSTYDDVMAFLERVDAASSRMHLTTFGYTLEGRALPLVVVGGVPDASPESVRAADAVRIYIQGNIHAGEVEGKEALQALLRDLAGGAHAAWDQSLVLLIAPIYNADGNERVLLTNRRLQNGPTGGMGQRPNAQGFDLNRDHMKLESPEARSLVRTITAYDPHVLLDLHTTNGTHHGYHLTYAPPLHPNTPEPVAGLLRGQLLPAVTERLKATDGWDCYYYGNVPPEASGRERGWYTFDHRPRFGNNYAGLRNRLGILSEAYAYLSFEDRIAATSRFVEEVVDWVAAHADAVRRVVTEADAEPIVGTELALRADFQRSVEPVDILMGDVARERHPLTGETVYRRLDVQATESMPEFGTFAPTLTTRVPSAYYVPGDLGIVIDRLEAHGIAYTTLEGARTVAVEEFAIRSSTEAEQAFQGHRERTLEGVYRNVDRELPAGTVVVEAAQPLGRLAFTLLEPQSDDGLANWNLLDAALEGADVYPILRAVP